MPAGERRTTPYSAAAAGGAARARGVPGGPRPLGPSATGRRPAGEAAPVFAPDDSSVFASDDDAPVFVISVAAELAGMHAQTLRQYDRLGLVTPSRTRGGGRRYSARDVAQLREVQRLSQEEGVSLAGIQRILELTNQVEALQARVRELREELDRVTHGASARFFAVSPSGDVAMRRGAPPVGRDTPGALVVWRPPASRR
ncbi:Putative heat shock protein hspR (modular protein) [Nostocoides japonicum T1-X7]|uniref:Putative heat shock protein hspR (Modular protein) n=1 Tax=Nostocoides japonicum T1-X7 TaxID=1194083 RepID=A0A077M3E5_9MICO|nr:Putative heat shock protein hspR (modular protein) [Tetrasphaera japonica T1-X7]